MFPGSGTEADPYRCSPITPEYLGPAVEASWKGTHGGLPISSTDRSYWMDKASHPEEYSDLLWRVGWNRYWETRMRPDNDGSANPKLGDLPAQYQPGDVIVPPEPPITDINAKLDVILENQGTILRGIGVIINKEDQIISNMRDIFSNMAANQSELLAAINSISTGVTNFPDYKGKLGLNMTFTPVK